MSKVTHDNRMIIFTCNLKMVIYFMRIKHDKVFLGGDEPVKVFLIVSLYILSLEI